MRTFAVVLMAGLALLAVDAASVVTAAREHAGGGELAAAERAVAAYLAATRAVDESGGDPRVAERVRASPDLVSEQLAGMAFAGRRLRVIERGELVRMEPRGSRWLQVGGAEVRTREYWILRSRPADGPAPEVTAVSAVLDVRYELVLEGSSWRVVDYRLDSTPDASVPGGD